ncbi:MAG: DNA primase [Bacillota bacterium]|nr:DNA primase [Bacillota bacterium]
MEGIFPGEFIDDLRSRFDIVSVISQYVQLKKRGRNYFGLCPFHDEKTPSFSVSQEKQIFHCFGCGEGGDVFTFLMKIEGLAFPDAVRELADRAGVPLPQKKSARSGQEKYRERLAEIMALANRFFQYNLQQPGGRAALKYLQQKRGLSTQTIKDFALGFAPDSWDALKSLLTSKGYKEREIMAAGLLSQTRQNTYDRFRNRVIFPVFDRRGRLVAFGGRALDGSQPKYLNSPETVLFNKSRILYALHLAREAIRKNKRAVIFEGYMDVITAHQAGIKEAVASLGTSLTVEQARLLRNQAEEVIIVYDADSAGQAATWRGLQILRRTGCLVKVGRLPRGLDPDDYIRRYGGGAFSSKILEQSLLLVDYQLESLMQQYDRDNSEGRLLLFDKVIEVLADIENAMEQEDYVQKAANLLKLPAQSIRRELEKTKKPGRAPGRITQPQKLPRSGAEEKAPLQILALWVRFPEMKAATADLLEPEDIPVEFQAVFAAAREAAELSPPQLLSLLAAEKHRQLLRRLLLEEEYDEKKARKALSDCVQYLKYLRIVRKRKEIEAQIAKLDSTTANAEIAALSREWLTLRKMEERINQAREGGKGVG